MTLLRQAVSALRTSCRGRWDFTLWAVPIVAAAGSVLLVLAASEALNSSAPQGLPRLGYSELCAMLAALSTAYLFILRQVRIAHARVKRLTVLFNAAPEAIIGVADSGRIRFANARVAELFGYTEVELREQPIETLIPNRFHSNHASLRENYVRAPRVRPMGHSSALVAVNKEGREFPVEVSLNRISVEREPVILCIVRDVTEQRRMREALIEANRELESTVAAMGRRTSELRELTSLAELLQSCTSEREIYPVACEVVGRLFPGMRGGLYLLNPSRTLAELASAWNRPEPDLVSTFAPEDCWALRRGRIHHCGGEDSMLRCRHAAARTDARASVCIPMAAQGEIIGVLTAWGQVASDVQQGTQEQVLRALAEQCALASANLRLREALRNQSIRDPLTGLFNRRFLDEWLDRELHRAARQASPLSVLMIDVDHFKRFNDSFGHQSGDLALRETCTLLQRLSRSSDVVCRLGGEEIAVLLPDTPLEGALQVARTLRTAVEQNVIRLQPQTLGSVTISIGIACSPEHGSSRDELLHAADVALYAAKEGGRNRIACATQTGTSTAYISERACLPSTPSCSIREEDLTL